MCVCTRVLLKATMSVWREVAQVLAHARRDRGPDERMLEVKR